MNQQGIYGQNNFGQQMQQQHDQYLYNNQQQLNPCLSNLQQQSLLSCNPCICNPGTIPQQQQQQNYLPQNIIEQIRSCVPQNQSPIFILPNSQPIQLPINHQNQLPILQPQNSQQFQHYDPHSNNNKNLLNCNCCCRTTTTKSSTIEDNNFHRCEPSNIDDKICRTNNCPASLHLQALASQLLSLQGVIPCAATRLILRKISGSNVVTSVEDTMERAKKSISLLNKEQLVNESKNAQHVNGLINLYMMSSNSRENVVSVLTMLQLKVNSLKSIVENLVNNKIIDCQSFGNDSFLETIVLSVKSDDEIRELLGNLRQKECEERVNVNYSPYHSQKVVAECRLKNLQNKINDVEREIERRKNISMNWIVDQNQGEFHHSVQNQQNCTTIGDQNFQCFNDSNRLLNSNQVYESPNPFMIQVKNPKRLNLKPNVGGAQTTMIQNLEDGNNFCSPEAFAVSKLEKSGTEESPKMFDGKKKLKIHVDKKGELSVKKQSLEGLETGEIVELSSSEVLLVIDKDKEDDVDTVEENKKGKKKLKNKEAKKIRRNKSPDSIPSNSTFSGSETSVSSCYSEETNCDDDDQVKDDKKKGKSGFENILKGKKKKKTPINEKDLKVNQNPKSVLKESEKRDEKNCNTKLLKEVENEKLNNEENEEDKNLIKEKSCMIVESRNKKTDKDNKNNLRKESVNSMDEENRKNRNLRFK